MNRWKEKKEVIPEKVVGKKRKKVSRSNEWIDEKRKKR